IPLAGSKLTLGLIGGKLAEHRITPRTVEVGAGKQESFGPFSCEFLAVNHSIPDALAVAIRTRAGMVLHTGDFKMDQLPLDGRKVALVGRSMVRNMGVARDLGYLRIPVVPGGLMVDLKEAEELPPERIVLISTGSQGEPMSALSRMAGRDHPIRVAEGDTVI